jgi:multiple sugar transport system substrate-binding protein
MKNFWKLGIAFGTVAASAALLGTRGTAQAGWTVTEAAKPYAGTTIKAVYLDRPGYKAAAKLVPEFEKLTGITVENEVIPYENTREKMVLDFTSKAGTYDVALTDVVWVGEYAANGWLTPLEKFTSDPKLADPALNLKGFFPILLDSFGTWDKKLYGIPFDNYAGLLFYNRCMLEKAGFKSPPKTWDELMKVYAPKLTNKAKGQYAYALQSRRGETQSADSFMRMLWPFGGSLIDAKTFEPNLPALGSIAKGLAIPPRPRQVHARWHRRLRPQRGGQRAGAGQGRHDHRMERLQRNPERPGLEQDW